MLALQARCVLKGFMQGAKKQEWSTDETRRRARKRTKSGPEFSKSTTKTPQRVLLMLQDGRRADCNQVRCCCSRPEREVYELARECTRRANSLLGLLGRRRRRMGS
eukprot:754904-Hanusia_phi.AAC.1